MPAQRRHTWLQLGYEVDDASCVAPGLGNLVLGFGALQTVLAHARGALEQLASLGRFQPERLIGQALRHQGVPVRAEAAMRQQLQEVAEPHAALVQDVFALAGAEGAAADDDLAEGDRQPGVLVIERELHVGQPNGSAAIAAGEHHVLGAPDTQGAGALAAQHPADGIGHVALAGPVGADDGRHAGRELQERARGKALEALNGEGL